MKIVGGEKNQTKRHIHEFPLVQLHNEISRDWLKPCANPAPNKSFRRGNILIILKEQLQKQNGGFEHRGP